MGNSPATVKRLVDRFDQDREVFLSGDNKEEELRFDFLSPLFTALSRDLNYRRRLPVTLQGSHPRESAYGRLR